MLEIEIKSRKRTVSTRSYQNEQATYPERFYENTILVSSTYSCCEYFYFDKLVFEID